ncbi:MAG TPA: sugar isomerase, partial [Actinomycetota bacterium]|nr:sugar isomerase [Actinomycetota bacterium]
MSETEQEIASQPDRWKRAAGLAHEVSAVLPARGERVAIVGCGTSLYMG